MNSLTDLRYGKNAGVATVTLNRPERMNAYRPTTLRELLRVLEDSANDSSVRVVVVTGTGRAFCAGEDLKDMAATLESAQALEEIAQQVGLVQSLTRSIVDHPRPVIAAVNGYAIGGGAELAVAADIRIASESARFAFVEASRGLLPTNGVHLLLPCLVGEGRALEMLLTGRSISAAEAQACGLVTQVTADEQLVSSAQQLAATIAAQDARSVQFIKKTVRGAYRKRLEAVLQQEADAFMKCCSEQDLRTAIRDFLQQHSAAGSK